MGAQLFCPYNVFCTLPVSYSSYLFPHFPQSTLSAFKKESGTQSLDQFATNAAAYVPPHPRVCTVLCQHVPSMYIDLRILVLTSSLLFFWAASIPCDVVSTVSAETGITNQIAAYRR